MSAKVILDMRLLGAVYCNVLELIILQNLLFCIIKLFPGISGVLAFETGYSYSSPHVLVLWEAQYGDFADTGQTVFDTFLANGESKWICQSALVCQLPHGIDGSVSFPFWCFQHICGFDSLLFIFVDNGLYIFRLTVTNYHDAGSRTFLRKNRAVPAAV